MDRAFAYQSWERVAGEGVQILQSPKPSITSWFKPGHFPSEPVFVPRNEGASSETDEDDGVILAQVLDGINQQTYLLVLDAATMTEVAAANLEPGLTTPYTQHGRWFPQI